MKENELRDIISEGLDILEEGLKLLNKEQYIPNTLGTRGFIDLYARDSEGNHVLIELKRSQPSTREAIHEILKYVEGVKSHFGAREDEIRVIIASTEWKELLAPYSRFVAETTISIIGINLIVDSITKKITSNKIKPIPVSKGRMIAPWYDIFWYTDLESLKIGEKDLIKHCIKNKIDDYIIIKIKAKKALQSFPSEKRQAALAHALGINRSFDIANKCKHILVFATQIFTEDEYISRLRETSSNFEEVISLLDCLNENGRLCHLHESLSDTSTIFNDDYEIGYPAKVRNYFCNHNFSISSIIRHGAFSRNELLSDHTIIAELEGNNGVTGQTLIGDFITSKKSQIASLKETIVHLFEDNSIWKNHILRIINETESELPESIIKINIHNPSTAIFTIYNYAKVREEEESISYIPGYTIEIYQNGKIKRLYYGTLKGDKSIISFKEIIDKYYSGDKSNLLISTTWGGRDNRDLDILEDLNLHYRSFMVEINKDQHKHFIFQNERWRQTEGKHPSHHFIEYISKNEELVSEIVNEISPSDMGFMFTSESTSEPEFLHIRIPRSDIEKKSLANLKDNFIKIISDKDKAVKLQGEVELSFDGYDNDNRELNEIPEVRFFLENACKEIPYLFYFLKLNGQYDSLFLIILCVAAEIVSKENGIARMALDYKVLDDFMNSQWQGLNWLTEHLNLGFDENKRISMEINEYISRKLG